jgi:ABC-type amino acid transport substrate-binding protein
MKALLINPIDKTIEEVEFDGDYKQIYKYIDAT